jgi:EmrB/QacA subfamily drug resistance transporter
MSVDKRARQDGWGTLLTLGLGVSVVIMDATIVNVALPVVVEDLRLDASDAQWLNASYALVFAALLLTVGRIADLTGRRRVFAAGLALFMAASVAAGLARSPGWLIAARLVQGVGAAMIVPATLSTLNATFTGRARGRAFAVWGASIGGMAAVGPFIGGWLATDVGWRWAFWLNIPVGLLVLAGIALFVPATRDDTSTPGYDLVGTTLSAVGMASIVFAFIEGSYFGWWRTDDGSLSPIPLVLVVGVAAMTVFVGYQRRLVRLARPALVDLNLFGFKTFRYGMIAAVIVAFGEFGLLFTIPLLLQGTLGYTALGTGLVILVLAVGTFLSSGAVPQLTARFGPRTVVRIGLGLEALSVAALALTLSTEVRAATIAACLFGYGAGVGLATAQLTSVLLEDVPVAVSGQASGLQSAGRQLGSALGVALLGGLLISTLGTRTEAALTALGLPEQMRTGIVTAVHDSAGIAIAGLQADPSSAASAAAAGQAMVDASRLTTGAAALVLLLGLLATFALPRSRPGRPVAAEGSAVTQ